MTGLKGPVIYQRGRGGWVGANGVGVIPFCAPENVGLHKIVQPFLRGHVFCAFLFPFHKKETTLKESTSVYQPAFHPPFWIYTRISGVLGTNVPVLQRFKARNYKTWRILRSTTTSQRRMDIVNRNSSLYQLDKSAALED